MSFCVLTRFLRVTVHPPQVLSSAADSVQRLEVYAGDSSTQTIDFEQLTEEESRRDDAGPRMDGEAGT